MANPEHLAILKQGSAAWNEWRLKHQDIRPDLIKANLEEANLQRKVPDTSCDVSV
jgi:hypothetical protein